MNGFTNSYEIKCPEILIKVKFQKKDNKINQFFYFDENRSSKYVRDNRFAIHDKFEEKLKELSLAALYDGAFSFLNRVDTETYTDLIFNQTKEIEDILKVYYFVIAAFIPKHACCSACVHNENKEKTFINCSLKNKTITKELKNCAYFRQINGIVKA